MTLREAEQWAREQLQGSADTLPNAGRDARMLVELAAGLSRAFMLARPDEVLPPAEEEALRRLVERRLRAEPMQHLRGSQEFYGRDFLVNPDVLIPRPETEDIVAAVLAAFSPERSVGSQSSTLHIADVGTGSGALAVTLVLELPQAGVAALDISPAALHVARQNAVRLGAADRIRFIESDLFDGLGAEERFDVVVSNPPYIPLGDAAIMHHEVLAYEPHTALFAGHDGHDLYRRLIPQARQRVRSGGLLVLETAGRVDLILQWLSADWNGVRVRNDLQGIARIVTARRN